MGLSRQEYQSGLPFPTPTDLPNLGIKPASLASPALTGGFFTTSTTWETHHTTFLSINTFLMNSLFWLISWLTEAHLQVSPYHSLSHKKNIWILACGSHISTLGMKFWISSFFLWLSSSLHFLLESNARFEKLKPSDFYFLWGQPDSSAWSFIRVIPYLEI